MVDEMGFDYVNDQQKSPAPSQFDDEYPSMEDESVRDAVGGLLLLSEIDPTSPPTPPVVNCSSSEEFPPASLEGKTWDCKRIRSGIKSCSAPPPSPENKHVTELLQKGDSLLCIKAVFEQEIQNVQHHQDEQRAFNVKLRKKEEEIDTSIPIGREIDQIRALQIGDKPASTINEDTAELHQNQEPLDNGHGVLLAASVEPHQHKPEELLDNPGASSYQTQKNLVHNHSKSSRVIAKRRVEANQN